MTLCSCSHGDDDGDEQLGDKTILVYMPWAGDLTSYFWTNISDMKEAYDTYAGDKEKMVVFICTSGTKAVMFDIEDYTGHDSQSLAQYTQVDNPAFTTASGIADILSQMKQMAPAHKYAMTIGCHGLGWVHVSSYTSSKARAKSKASVAYHWENNDGGAPTRFFGGKTSSYWVDITTLAQALNDTGTKLQFLLFDDCYMASLEAAYDLRDVTDYLIACPTEVMIAGMPYSQMGRYLFGVPDYEQVCNSFINFYSSYTYNGKDYPYGTISVTRTSELSDLAAIVKEINSRYQFNASQLSDVQPMCGYSPHLFYDYGDYVAHYCDDESLLQQFNEQMERVVPYKAHTDRFPSNANGYWHTVAITAYSGITTSEPSQNSLAADVNTTAWYTDTH